jgi:hypothetical protein
MINRFHSPKPQPFDQSLPNQLKINHICFIVLMDQFKSEGGQGNLDPPSKKMKNLVGPDNRV